ncbi:MAG: RNA-directed DNA polymerase [Alphaproteobacteria bacterium]|nr:RNA-directed DNA polymerase [Alphaproteobacteria bacterium]
MRLPHHNLESVCFLFEHFSELIKAMGDKCPPEEAIEIERLFNLGLPPVTSENALATMLGYNPGFIWSLLNRTSRYYRQFDIPKGAGTRKIDAPKIALKAIQKWLSYHFQKKWIPNEHIFGFLPGKSHMDAASKHLSSKWVYSIDIQNYFPSISTVRVRDALENLGYSTEPSLKIIPTLCCLRGSLVQGSPASPVLSNIVLKNLDEELANFAREKNWKFTRYADDIVFSGIDDINESDFIPIKLFVNQDGWMISDKKTYLARHPNRLKVHGLLVHGDTIRLTKGYRNRIRAFRHLLNADKIKEQDLAVIRGHLNYSAQVDDFQL